ncbi:MAG: VOC family protein [Flavobacteriaceae bacterium]|nr:MAG: VOC family protein [Flavobacteriaceae bacterium]
MDINMVSWFEIPVNDMDRAKKFYESVFQVELSINDFGGILMGWFPPAEDITVLGISGSLVKHETEYIPSATHGALVYFNSQSGDIDNELSRVESAGGRILKPKTLISNEIGYMAVILDTEGNRIALYNK